MSEGVKMYKTRKGPKLGNQATGFPLRAKTHANCASSVINCDTAAAHKAGAHLSLEKRKNYQKLFLYKNSGNLLLNKWLPMSTWR